MNDKSPKPYFCKSAWTCPEQNHCNSLLKMNERTPRTRGNFSWTTQWGAMTAYFRPSHQKSIAPLICRVVRAMRAVRWRWALGLDSRWGTPLRSVFHPQPPISIDDSRSIPKGVSRSISRGISQVGWLKKNLTKSNRFRTSGSTF